MHTGRAEGRRGFASCPRGNLSARKHGPPATERQTGNVEPEPIEAQVETDHAAPEPPCGRDRRRRRDSFDELRFYASHVLKPTSSLQRRKHKCRMPSANTPSAITFVTSILVGTRRRPVAPRFVLPPDRPFPSDMAQSIRAGNILFGEPSPRRCARGLRMRPACDGAAGPSGRRARRTGVSSRRFRREPAQPGAAAAASVA
jgi:hypothetical protein